MFPMSGNIGKAGSLSRVEKRRGVNRMEEDDVEDEVSEEDAKAFPSSSISLPHPVKQSSI